MSILDTLKERGLTLPPAPTAVANYVPAARAGDVLFLAGQLPFRDGKLAVTGKVGAEVSLDQARAQAEIATLNALAVIQQAIGDLERVVRIARVTVYVNAVPDFTQHAQVANGASDLLVALFGDAGRHARSSLGVGSLPLGAPVEVELTVHVR